MTIDFAGLTTQQQQAQFLADQLRKQAAVRQMPQGQMVSGHYIAPHWTQYLGGLMDQGNALWQNNIANQAANNLAQAQEAHAQEWRSSLPQAIAARAAVPDQAATPFGSRDEPQQDAVVGSPAMPYQPVSTAARLKATLEGMRNPLIAKEAAMWERAMSEEATREDTQAARQETLKATLQLQRELRMAQLEQQERDAARRSEDARASIAQRAEAAREAAATRLAIAQLVAATKSAGGSNGMAEERQLRREERNQDKIDKQIEHIGARMKDVAPLLISGQAVQNMFDSYGDKVPDGLGMVGRKLPTGVMPNSWVQNQQTVQALINSLVRNQAGLSQTLSETENAKLELIVNGTATGKQFKDAWEAIREKVNAYPKTISASYLPEAVETYNARGGNLKPIVSKRQSKPAQADWKIEEVK